MLFTLFTIIGLLLLAVVFLKIFAIAAKTGTMAFMTAIYILLLGMLMPFTYLSKYKWLWIVQVPLLLFYGLFIYFEGWAALPYIITINCLVFLLIHSFTWLSKKTMFDH